MKRYLVIISLIFYNPVFSQNSDLKKHNLSLKLVSKLDLGEKFDLSDNNVSLLFRDQLLKKNISVSDEDPRYFISISFGWKYRRATELKIDNYKGFIIDKKNEDKVISEFSSSKIRDLDESIRVLVKEIFNLNNRMDDSGKFIDISDHFQRMDMKSWNSSRPDSHGPALIFGDHTHKRGGIMIGLRGSYSNSEDVLNDNVIFNQNQITQFYNLHVYSQRITTHYLEFMYGINDKLTISSVLSFLNYKSNYLNKKGDDNYISSSGLGDTELQFLYGIFKNNWLKFHLNIGLIIPTGNNKKDLPYQLHTGDGYFSSLIGSTILFQTKKFSGGLQPIFRSPLHMNSKNYKLGNFLDFNYWVSYLLTDNLSISYRQNYLNKGSISGIDENLDIKDMILNNSSNYGHIIFDNAFGLNFSFSNRNLINSRLSLEYSFPIYQSFNGLQTGNINKINLSLQYSPGGHKNH
tara:strand:+ start:780 stop:2165 length:1386 start_codon:yes stop_codon:yes gene_type:complete